jgi:hypothetical protein
MAPDEMTLPLRAYGVPISDADLKRLKVAAVLAAAIDAVTVIGDGAAPSRPYTAGPRNCACYPDGKRCEKVDRSL